MKYPHFSPILLLGCCTLLSWTFTACESTDDDLAEGNGTLTFQLAARETTSSTTPRLTRLYLAQRLAEHTEQTGPDAEFLHCGTGHRYWIFQDIYSLSGLRGQWYKFAFVDVPHLKDTGMDIFEVEKEAGNGAEHNFNRLTLDFSPVLKIQQQLNAIQKEDLSIYRKIKDRWIHPTNPNFEDVTLSRITGEWVVDMGIPEDQFPYPIRQFTLHLQGYLQTFYLHDEANNEVILKKDKLSTQDFVWTVNNQKERQVFHVTLLPGDYSEAYVNAEYDDADHHPQSIQIPLTDQLAQKITTRSNTRTHLLYNGMEKEEFEIRYAGFNNSSITVGPDDWNGIN